VITRQEIESFIPGQWTLTDEKMREIKELALWACDIQDELIGAARRAAVDGMVSEAKEQA